MLRIESQLRSILEHAIRVGASDVHLVESTKPRLRIHGELVLLEEYNEVRGSDILAIVSAEVRKNIESGEIHEYDFAYQLKNHRFRVNFFRESRGLGATFRYIPNDIKSLSKLGLPSSLKKFAYLPRGLVIVTGPTGSGKSTTLAALIDEVNRNRSCRIFTIEDPIEFVHEDRRSFISHRELERHTHSFTDALRAVLREDPDVILVGEMRDTETMQLAIEAALTGHLVFSTLHTISAAKTVDRIIEGFSHDKQNQVRADLADVIEGVISQILLPRADGEGRVCAYEIMVANQAIRNLIREKNTFQIPQVLQTSVSSGMITLDSCLEKLVKTKLIQPEQAYLKAINKDRFVKYLPTNFDVSQSSFQELSKKEDSSEAEGKYRLKLNFKKNERHSG